MLCNWGIVLGQAAPLTPFLSVGGGKPSGVVWWQAV
tara:strand:+ start:595 stop:702 length:108 start_codon:yes stop_codon:yes gene_type:complete